MALKALLPYYAGRVKCIYIDPPYNTGNEGWVYNDNVNSPEIKAWLGKVVGKEGEDLSRHDKWLCMMYPRLRLLREFLTRKMARSSSALTTMKSHHLDDAIMNDIFGQTELPRNDCMEERKPDNNPTQIVVTRECNASARNTLNAA